ncbi:MAG: 50S ribosomal protein L23 [Candidatus Paceibacterota bacterium]|jgi:large subunit ribosomal protein L23|nr:50S ribosomal protein L23 [Candidatus Paceibacterota bacterium]
MTTKIYNNKSLTVILKRPRVTEKAAILVEKNAYTFEVAPTATKPEVKAAIIAMYKVTPVQINMTAGTRKNIVRRGKAGVKTTSKKAVVHLKKGDKIEFI